ncbi:MAG: hypothetical protein U0236_09235 [Nitrospira sp.]
MIAPSHRYAYLAQAMLTRASQMLREWAKATAEQLNPTAVWQQVCEFITTTLTGVNRLAGMG